MKELSIKIKGAKKLNPIVEVDGKTVLLTKNQYGNYEGKLSIEKESVRIKVYRVLELSSPLWLLKSIFYFLISIFGLLDTMKEKNFTVIDCDLTLNLANADTFSLELTSRMQNNGKAFEITSNGSVQENNNICFVDTRAKKRNRLLKFLKLIIFLGVVCGAIIGLGKIFGYY